MSGSQAIDQSIDSRTEAASSGPLQGWLGTLPLAEFRTQYLRKQPFAAPSRAKDAVASCDWQVLDRLLQAAPPDLLVVAHGELLDVPPPRSLAELHALLDRGIGIAIRNPEPLCPELATLGRAFARDIAGAQRLIIFATPQKAHGFGWHYDAEDVFILQTAGDKEYLFRRNTIDPHPARGVQPDFSVFRRETSPVMSCRLLTGDWLYLPRGFWHVAHAHEPSLSISIGVFPEGM